MNLLATTTPSKHALTVFSRRVHHTLRTVGLLLILGGFSASVAHSQQCVGPPTIDFDEFSLSAGDVVTTDYLFTHGMTAASSSGSKPLMRRRSCLCE